MLIALQPSPRLRLPVAAPRVRFGTVPEHLPSREPVAALPLPEVDPSLWGRFKRTAKWISRIVVDALIWCFAWETGTSLFHGLFGGSH